MTLGFGGHGPNLQKLLNETLNNACSVTNNGTVYDFLKGEEFTLTA